RRFIRRRRQAEIGAEIEEVVLNPRQNGLDRAQRVAAAPTDREPRKPDRAIRLVHVADRGDARVGFPSPRAVAEAGFAPVAGAGVDDVQSNHIRAPSLISIRVFADPGGSLSYADQLIENDQLTPRRRFHSLSPTRPALPRETGGKNHRSGRT